MGLFEKEITYNEELVNSAIDALKESKTKLSGTEDAMNAGATTIVGAKGFTEYVGTLETDAFAEFVTGCTSAIDKLVQQIESMQEDIIAYNNSNGVDKFLGSALMGITKFGEGFASVFESLIDGGATVVGWVGGLVSPEFQDSVADFIKKDHVGDFFYDQYENGALKWVDQHSNFSHTSDIAGGFKVGGEIAGYIGLSAIGGAALGVSSTAATTFVSALGGLGEGTEGGLQAGKSFGSASIDGIKQAVVQGGMAYAGGKLGEKAAANKSSSILTSNGDDAAKGIVGASDELTAAADDLAKAETALNKGNARYKAGEISSEELGRLEQARDAARKTYTNLGGNSNDVISATNKVNKAEELLNSGNKKFKAGEISSEELGRLEEARDAARKSFRETISTPTTTSTGANSQISTVLSGAKSRVSTALSGAKETFKKIPVIGKATSGAVNLAMAHPNISRTVIAGVGGTMQFNEETASQTFRKQEQNSALSNTLASTEETIRSNNPKVFDTMENTAINRDAINQLKSEGEQTANTPGNNSTPNQSDNNTENNTQSTGSPITGGTNGGGSASTQFRVADNRTPSNTGGTSSTTTPTVNAPEVETPSTNTPSTETPSTGGTPSTETPDTGTNGDMSGDISTGEEQVPETPSTSTPDAGTPGGVAGNIVNNAGSTGGISGSTGGGNYSGSVVGGFNSQSQNTPIGPEAQLNPEDNIANIAGDNSEIENGTISAVKPGKDNTLDVISIDKNDTTTPNVDTSSAGSAIPAVLGVGAAGAAGVAGIHYIQKKNGKDDEYYEDEEDSSNDTQNSFLGGNYNAQNIDTIGEYDNSQEQQPAPERYKAGTMNELSLDDGADVTIDDNDIIAPQKEELE